MSKFKKLMMIAALLLGLSSVFVACSDDDPTTMGPVPVNSVRATGTSVTVIWSIVPNDKCGGYEVSILQGTKDGAVVATQKLDNRTCKATFDGLTPGTEYVVKTQCVPGKGFSGAEVYYREFTTAPVVDVQVSTMTAYTAQEYDATGQPVVKDYYKVSFTWPAVPKSNCGGYGLRLYQCPKADVGSNDPVDSNQFGKSETTTATFEKLLPETVYTLAIRTTPNAMCDYTNGDWNYIEFTTPAVPAANN